MAWEAPVPRQLLVSARRVADELDAPVWKANELCWCLGRYFYSPGQAHYRVPRRSLDTFKDMLAMGVCWYDAKTVMAYYSRGGALPPRDLSREEIVGRAHLENRRGYY